MENVHSSGHSPVSQIATYILCAFRSVLSLPLLWTVLLGPHQNLWLCTTTLPQKYTCVNSPKWPVLCRVGGRRTFTCSIKLRLCAWSQEKHNEILKYNNQLAALQTRLDRAENKALRLESRWTYLRNTASSKTLLLGRIKMCVRSALSEITLSLRVTVILTVTCRAKIMSCYISWTHPGFTGEGYAVCTYARGSCDRPRRGH